MEEKRGKVVTPPPQLIKKIKGGGGSAKTPATKGSSCGNLILNRITRKSNQPISASRHGVLSFLRGGGLYFFILSFSINIYWKKFAINNSLSWSLILRMNPCVYCPWLLWRTLGEGRSWTPPFCLKFWHQCFICNT